MIAAGWCQGAGLALGLHPGDGLQRCLGRALSDAGFLWSGEEYLAYREALLARCHGLTVDYNDAPERTQQEVLDLLDEAIANYEDAGADL